MIYRDPKCVYVANEIPEANLVAGWLEGHDIPAQAMNEATLGGFEGLNWLLPGASYKGIEVWVLRGEDAEAARKLIAEVELEKELKKKKHEARTEPIAVACDKCGQTTVFPASDLGKTGNCSHCYAYVDVPDPDEDWSGVDFGEPEKDEAEKDEP